MNISTEHILQCNQSEPLADAKERIVDLMNENGSQTDVSTYVRSTPRALMLTTIIFQRFSRICVLVFF